MKQIAIVSEMLGPMSDHEIQTHCVFINKCPVHVALIETDDILFDPNDDANADRALVRKTAFSVNFRDTGLVLQSSLFFKKNPHHLTYFPIGSEFVAEVLAIGKNVTHISVGDRVIPNCAIVYNKWVTVSGVSTNNASKELEIFPGHRLIRIPDTMSDEVAAGFSIGAQTSYSMIRRAQIQEGENVMVTAGTSNTSLFLIQALLNMHVNLHVLTSSVNAVNYLKQLGVKQVYRLDVNKPREEVVTMLKTYTDETGGMDVVFDPFFDIYFLKILPSIAPFGRYISCGLQNQHPLLEIDAGKKEPLVEENGFAVGTHLMLNNISVIGNCLGKDIDMENALKDFSEGKLNVQIDSVFYTHQIPDFFAKSYSAVSRFGKVIMKYA